MKHELPELPWDKAALAPHMSVETIEFHYGKHHKGYVDKLNGLIEGTEFENASLEEIVMNANGAIFNNGAQAWNHSFFWNSLTPRRFSPNGDLAQTMRLSFGSIETFKERFAAAATGQFGSGWVWLVLDTNGTLIVETTANADNPLKSGKIPLLTCDVWEHAYYLDYHNERERFVNAFWNICNWNFAASNLHAAIGRLAA